MNWTKRFCIYASCVLIAVGLMCTRDYIIDHWLDGDVPVYVPEGNCNICLGKYAGWDLTDEKLQFVFAVPDSVQGSNFYGEYSTTMTPQEYAVVFRVAKRASENIAYKEIPANE